MHRLPLLKRGSQGPMQAVLQVELSPPRDDVGKEITVEGGVLLEQSFQIQRPLGGHQLVEAQLMRGDRGPLLLHIPMVGIRAQVADSLENHAVTLIKFHPVSGHNVVTIWHMAEPERTETEDLSTPVRQIAEGYTTMTSQFRPLGSGFRWPC